MSYRILIWSSGLLLLASFLSCSETPKKVSHTEEIANRDTIPFELSEGNNIKFKTLLNGVDSLDLYFDTGGTDLVLTHKTVKEKTTLLQDRNQKYKGENYVPLEVPNSLSLGTLNWDSLSIYPVSIGPEDMDGHFGWNLFKDKIIELNYDDNYMVIHTNVPPIPAGFTKLPLEYSHTLVCIQASFKINEKAYLNRYLLDSGFQRALVLDKDLREAADFPTDLPVVKESKLKNSVGKVFVNKVVKADQFCFNENCLEGVPAQLISTPNPARFETHILGNELLKLFNTIFDFQNHHVYFKPNSLANLPYADDA